MSTPTRPLKRTMHKKKVVQRHSMHNDIVKLHARRMNKLCAETKKLPHLESELHELCQLWQQQRKAFTDIECTIRHKLQDSDRNGITALRQRRSVLHDRLKSDKVIIEAKESYIIDVKDGTIINDYLLHAVQFLNVQHACNSDSIAIQRQLTTCKTEMTRRQLREKLSVHQMETRHNSHSYTQKFYPDLVRDDNKTTATKTVNPFLCNHCGGEVEEKENSVCVCLQCGVIEVGFSIRDPTANLNWDDMQNAPGRQYTYRRLNHFREYLRQIQGKSRATIPLYIYQELKEEFRKSRIPLNQVTPDRVKTKLKKIKRSKYYEHRESIATSINNEYKPIDIDTSHEEKLCLMFVQLEEPFERIKHLVKSDRKNFLSYPFVYFKLNELSGWDGYNKNCSLLKSVSLINRQDRWWKLVMTELDWENVGRTFDVHRVID
jgi:hypothetical protein